MKLKNGREFPAIGLGTYRVSDEQVRSVAFEALKCGYRLLDTAAVYRNEAGVGYAVNQAVKEGVCSRQEIYVTSKLSPRDQGLDKALLAFDTSLGNLNLDCMDCYLIHWPGGSGLQPSDKRNANLRKGSWQALEQIYSQGKAKSIGVSNYTVPHLRELLEYCTVKPHVLQTEFHPCLFDRELIDFCRENDIQLQAYSSLGEGSFLNGVVEIHGLGAIALKHKVSKAQVLLKWALQHDIAIIPKTTSLERLKPNRYLDGFLLDESDMEVLDNCETRNRFCWDPTTGTWVWVEAPNVKYLKAGTVSVSSAKETTVKFDKDQVTVPTEKVKPMHQASIDGVPDMTALPDLHEGSLLHNLRTRYKANLVYTYVGSILVAVNPYKALKIYEPNTVKEYKGKPIGELPPHVFAVADDSYYSMLKNLQNQCVIISGESGAGKTETTKIILQYLAMLSGKHSQIEERILASSPILESFGNACTVRNNNSSRFGKFIEIQFTEQGSIEGGKIREYLLEKSRIVSQAPKERNYHSFYCMLSGLTDQQKQEWKLTKPEDYFFLNRGGMTKVDSINDKEDFGKLKAALDNLDFPVNAQTSIFQVLAIILHLGNITFGKTEKDEGSLVTSKPSLDICASLLSVKPDVLAYALTNKVSVTRNETFTTPLNPGQATDSRDALAKALYSWLFGWLVKLVNEKIELEKSKMSIGVLDIFGFEDFEKNSFEQLCINYANERLQQFFNNFVFKVEQEEYKAENIPWQEISFVDNQLCLDLISKKPMGILQLLDEESQLPKATDKSFVEKVRKNHEQNSFFSKSKTSDITFVVAHYAGKITYNTDGFLDKNRDMLRPDLEKVCIESNFKFVSDLILSGQLEDAMKKETLRTATVGRSASPSPPPGAGTVSGSSSKKTAGAKFDESLSLLVVVLSNCSPHFVRCIKPNTLKKPDVFDEEMILQQLRYSGLLETVKIRSAGYPVRRTYRDFIQRFRVLISAKDVSNERAATEAFVKSHPIAKTTKFAMGNTRLFYREALESVLEKERSILRAKKVLVIQRYVRGFAARSRYQKKRNGIIALQTKWRQHHAKATLRARKEAVLKIQRFYRSTFAKKLLHDMQDSLVIVQSALRIRMARAIVANLLETASTKSALRVKKREPTMNIAETFSTMTLNATPQYHEDIEILLEQSISERCDKNMAAQFLEQLQKKDSQSFGVPVDPIKPHTDFENYEEVQTFTFNKFVQAYFMGADETYSSVALHQPVLSNIPENLFDAASSCFQSIMVLMENMDLDSPLSMMDRALYIVTVAITNGLLADEIFCQICKQIVNNPSPPAIVNAWRLSGLFLMYFSPTDLFAKYLYKFIGDTAPPPVMPLLETRLLRSMDAGPRTTPPSKEEFVLFGAHTFMLELVFPGDEKVTVDVDSITNCEEVLYNVMSQKNVTSYPGWAVFNLVNGFYENLPADFHIFDLDPEVTRKICQTNASKYPTALYIRKEYIEPSEVIRDDTVALMAYIQCTQAIKSTPYPMEPDVASKLVACAFLESKPKKGGAEFAKDMMPPAFRPHETFARDIDDFCKKWANETPISLKKEFVYAASLIPAFFGCRFVVQVDSKSMDEVYKTDTPKAGKPIELCVDKLGVHVVLVESKAILLTFNYADMNEVVQDEKAFVLERDGKPLLFATSQATAICKKISEFRTALLQSSVWAVAIRNHSSSGDAQLLSFKQGDVIEVLEKKSAEDDWWKGRNHNVIGTIEGYFRKDSVKPVAAKPTSIVQRAFVPESADLGEAPSEASSALQSTNSLPVEVKREPGKQAASIIPMIEWAMINFRIESKKKPFNVGGTVRGTIRRLTGSEGKEMLEQDMTKVKERLMFAKNPIKHSLMRFTADEERLCPEIFLNVMKFMGDYPVKEHTAVDFATFIICRGLEIEQYRNEIYMQLLRQLTENPNPKSEAKGWRLLHMVSCYFAPTNDLLMHFFKWMNLQSVTPGFPYKAEASKIDKNLRVTAKLGPRKLQPTVEEITFQELSRPISVQVFLPGSSSKRLQAIPCTSVTEVLQDICKKLGIDKPQCYALFAESGRRYCLLFPDEYILDTVRERDPVHPKAFLPRKLFLKRKTWEKSFMPTNSIELNIINQQILELHMSGNTSATLGECTNFAGLQMRANSVDTSGKDVATKIAAYKQFLPKTIYSTIKPEAWVKEIDVVIGAMKNLDVESARKQILKVAQGWPLYGAIVFNVVDPKCDKISMPLEVVVVVAFPGITILHSDTKAVLARWKYDEVAGYSFAPDKFNLKIGGMMEKNQTVFKADTVQGREICHIIDYYGKMTF